MLNLRLIENNISIEDISYYSPKTKKVLYVDSCEEEIDDLIALPTKYNINEYSIMEGFIETIKDDELYNQLLISIKGSGTFRRFKNKCINCNIINDWYKFRDDKYKEIAIDWCKENNIDYKE